MYEKYEKLVYTPPDLLARFCLVNLSNTKNLPSFWPLRGDEFSNSSLFTAIFIKFGFNLLLSQCIAFNHTFYHNALHLTRVHCATNNSNKNTGKLGGLECIVRCLDLEFSLRQIFYSTVRGLTEF